MQHRRHLDGRADLVGPLAGAARVQFGHDHGELLAAVATGDVLAAHLGLDQPAHLGEQRVTGRMAVGVVEALEMVHVEHQHRQRQPAALAALQFAGEVLLEIPAIEQARQRIAQ